MNAVTEVVVFTTAAGAAIPLGGLLARVEHIQPRWLETELRHAIVAFGGGVLLAAVALVLVPHGTRHLGPAAVAAAFSAGGLAFLFADRAIATRTGSMAQLMAMLLDFVPEAMALGAAFASERSIGVLLALLIGLQNLPEGFNAYRELAARPDPPRRALAFLAALVVLGPLAGLTGHVLLAPHPALLGAVMLFAAGGILYLTFQDIAPQAALRRHWAPPLGAVAGFATGLLGQLLVSP